MIILTTAKPKRMRQVIDFLRGHNALNAFSGLIPIPIFIGNDMQLGARLKQFAWLEQEVGTRRFAKLFVAQSESLVD
jgi:hypothetical protein